MFFDPVRYIHWRVWFVRIPSGSVWLSCSFLLHVVGPSLYSQYRSGLLFIVSGIASSHLDFSCLFHTLRLTVVGASRVFVI